MNYLEFRKKSHQEKIAGLNALKLCEDDFIFELYYYSHHDKIYKLATDSEFFSAVYVKEIEPFIENNMYLFDKVEANPHQIISFYCLIQKLLGNTIEDKKLKKKFTDYLKEKYMFLLNQSKKIRNEKKTNKDYEAAIFNLEQDIQFNRNRNDITFEEIENLNHLSINYIKYSGSSLPYNNILNINSHAFCALQRDYFNHYISAEKLYNHIVKNKETFKNKIDNFDIDNKTNLNFIDNNKIGILKESISSLKRGLYYSSLSTIVPLVEDIFRNIAFNDFLEIIWEKYGKGQYQKDNFILKSPPMIKDFFSKIIEQESEKVALPKNLSNEYIFLDYNMVINFEFLLTSKYGLYIRNTLAHGSLAYDDLDFEGISSYLIYLTLCLCYY